MGEHDVAHGILEESFEGGTLLTADLWGNLPTSRFDQIPAALTGIPTQPPLTRFSHFDQNFLVT